MNLNRWESPKFPFLTVIQIQIDTAVWSEHENHHTVCEFPANNETAALQEHLQKDDENISHHHKILRFDTVTNTTLFLNMQVNIVLNQLRLNSSSSKLKMFGVLKSYR